MCASPVAGISSKHSPKHEGMCVREGKIVCACVCVFVCVTECVWLSVCDQFPEATAARRVPEWRKLLCDDYQVAHTSLQPLFSSSFSSTFLSLISVLHYNFPVVSGCMLISLLFPPCFCCLLLYLFPPYQFCFSRPFFFFIITPQSP